MLALCRRFISLESSQRVLVLEAGALMAFVFAGLRVLPFLTLRRALHRFADLHTSIAPRLPPSKTVDAIHQAITRVAGRVPSATCLVQALTADAMLRRRGLESNVRLGVRICRDDGDPIRAHAWVETLDGVIIGAAARQPEFEVLTQ